jgi:hypothetical protein
MLDHTSSIHDVDPTSDPETAELDLLLNGADTQVIEIDCIYTACLLSELESEFEPDDPEVVELIGHNTPMPRD